MLHVEASCNGEGARQVLGASCQEVVHSAVVAPKAHIHCVFAEGLRMGCGGSNWEHTYVSGAGSTGRDRGLDSHWGQLLEAAKERSVLPRVPWAALGDHPDQGKVVQAKSHVE